MNAIPAASATLLVLCDQPNLSPEAIIRLAHASVDGRKTIVAAQYGDHFGPPVLFARRHFQELTELHGPGGARPLLARHADLVSLIDLPELAIDLDTPEDYRAFLQPFREPVDA